ncbi:MAG: hypothetical protein GXY08_11130 [Ruminococcus sp.]|nr:hypothetical protein [Ruminococcus sp.]
MEIIPLKCPSCGADIISDNKHELRFCSYCGTQLHFDDGHRSIHIVDETKIAEINLQHHILDEKRKAKEELQHADSLWLGLCCLLISIVFCTIFIAMYLMSDDEDSIPGLLFMVLSMIAAVIVPIILAAKRPLPQKCIADDYRKRHRILTGILLFFVTFLIFCFGGLVGVALNE